MRGTRHLQQQPPSDNAGSPVKGRPHKRRRKHTLSLGSIRKYLVRVPRAAPRAALSPPPEVPAPQAPLQLGSQLTQRLTSVLSRRSHASRRVRAPPRSTRSIRHSATSPTSSITSASTGTSQHLPCFSPVRTSSAPAAAGTGKTCPVLCAGFSFTPLDAPVANDNLQRSSFRPVVPRSRRSAACGAYTQSLAADKGSRIHLLTSIAKQQLQNQVRQNAYAGRVALLK